MKVTREKVENSQVFLTVEMEPVEVEASLKDAYRRVVKKTNIPGFRKGKAPRAMLEHYIGREGLLEEALKHLVPEAYEKAIEEQDIKPFAPPNIEMEKTEPVIFKAAVPLPPEVTLGDYNKINVTKDPVEIKDDDVNKMIEQLRHQHATWEPAERLVDFGDLVVIDVESSVDNKPFINQKGIQHSVLREEDSQLPGFNDQLVGMNKGEEKEFKIQLPPEYPDAEMAGKEASFKVGVGEIKQEILPELDDDFAKQVNAEFEKFEIMRERIASNLKLRAEEKSRADFESKIIEAVAGLTKVEFPPVLVEMEVNQLLNEQSRRFQMEGRSMEEYLSVINKTEEQLREELSPTATKRVTNGLVLGKVAEAENIEVSDAEIDAEIENMLKDATESNKVALSDYFNAPETKDSIRQMLHTRKTVQRLVEIAEGSAKNELKEE